MRFLSMFVLPMLASRAANAAPGTCVVSGPWVSFSDVEIRPAGKKTFVIGISDLPAAVVVPERAGQRALLEVRGDFAFRDYAKNPAYYLRASTTLMRDLVSLNRGALLWNAHADGDMVVGDVVMGMTDTGGRIGPQTLNRVRVRCDTVSLNESADPNDPTPRDSRYGNPPLVGYARTLRIHSTPETRGASVMVEGVQCLRGRYCLEFDRVSAADPAWVHVVVAGTRSKVEGWMPRAALLHWPTADERMGYHPPAHTPCEFGTKAAERTTDPNILYQGQAAIRPGSGLYASRLSTQPWGVLSAGRSHIVTQRTGEAMVELQDRRITVRNDAAAVPFAIYLPVADITLPPGAVFPPSPEVASPVK